MRSQLFKRVISICLGLVMVCGLVACGGDTTTTTPTEGEAEGSNSIVAVVNGKNITRSEIGEELKAAEQEVISEYIYNMMLTEFFKDVVITDADVALQMELIKSQVGEESWPMYLAYYGGGSEETFKVMLADSLRQEEYIKGKMETLTITDEELLEVYNKDSNAYNIAVMDVLFLPDTAKLDEAKALHESGKTLEEISTALELDIYKAEHTYYYSEGLTWEKDFNDCAVGDYNYSKEDSGSLVFGVIVELNEGIENSKVKADLEDTLKYDKAYEIANEEYIEFLKIQTVTIMGESYSLYQEETQG